MSPQQRAFARPKLRPYLPDLRFCRTVGAGVCVLCSAARAGVRRAVRAVLGEAPKKPTTADRVDRAGQAALAAVAALAATGGAVAAAWHTVGPYGSWVLAGGVVVLVVAALAAAPPGEPAPGGQEPPLPEPPAAPGPARPVRVTPRPLTPGEVAAAVRAVAVPRGWLGAHLDDVLAHLPGRSKGELLGVLAAAGIPVADQLKLILPGGRQRNRQGVRLSALPPTPGGGPAHPGEGAPSEAPAGRVPDLTPATPTVTTH